MTYDFSQMKLCEILPGFWYDATFKSDPRMSFQIKLTRDGFYDVNGWKVVARDTDEGSGVCMYHSHTLDECKNFVKNTLIYGKPYNALRKELEDDFDFLKRDVHSKSWEIAEHIRYVLDNVIGD